MNKNTYLLLFVCACVAQLAIPVSMIASRELILRQGEVFRFRTVPVDPYDPFRGRYVSLRLFPLSAPAPIATFSYQEKAFAHIEVDDDGFVQFKALSLTPPDDVPYLKVRVRGVAPRQLTGAGRPGDVPTHVRVTLPFDRYYMQEKLAPEAERAYIDGWRREGLSAYVSVRIRSGSAVIEDLYLDGKPIRQYLAEKSTR